MGSEQGKSVVDIGGWAAGFIRSTPPRLGKQLGDGI